MPLPNDLIFTPLDPLSANELNMMMDNMRALQDGTSGLTLPNGSVSNEKVVDDTLDGSKINWSATGADAGIWWEELGRNTLAVAGDSLLVEFTPKRYLTILIATIPSGVINTIMRFNNDSGSNYAHKYSVDSGASSAAASGNAVDLESSNGTWAGFFQIAIHNFQTAEKFGKAHISIGAAGAANTPQDFINAFKWANTASQINRIELLNTGAGSFDIGSQIIVLGHD